MLHDALFNIGYRVMVLSYLVMYCGDKVLSHLGGVCPVHNLTYGVPHKPRCEQDVYTCSSVTAVLEACSC